MKLTILGAAKTVTGSKYLLETEQGKVLVDCGLFQGKKELRLINWEEPKFDPKSLSAIVLTHAHIDHSGYLPAVVKRGFKGPIYCTAPTLDLLKLLLPDSAHLQEEEARYSTEHKTAKHQPALPLYTVADAEQTLKLLKPFDRHIPLEIIPGLTVTATRTGHILGAVSLRFESSGKVINFSGDVGRYNVPMLADPEPAEFGDLLLCESTYGDRVHGDLDVKEELLRIIKIGLERRGPIIIPSFAVGRTQTLLYFLAELEREGKLPSIPVFVDSPMAVDATSLYRKYNFDFDEESQQILSTGNSPLLTSNTNFCRTVQESKLLNFMKGSRIIISASGMITGGRILHHMMRWLDKEETTIVFVGYQGEGTRGRLIQSGIKEIKIYGQQIAVRAKIENISGLSAHGDRNELLRWLKSCSGSPKVRIVHGEPEAGRAFAAAIQKELRWEAAPADYLEEIEI
jgi:metallo-beta-lactamase family protein